jgi:hypothetical protein
LTTSTIGVAPTTAIESHAQTTACYRDAESWAERRFLVCFRDAKSLPLAAQLLVEHLAGKA